jgi:hypothetical protein
MIGHQTNTKNITLKNMKIRMKDEVFYKSIRNKKKESKFTEYKHRGIF